LACHQADWSKYWDYKKIKAHPGRGCWQIYGSMKEEKALDIGDKNLAYTRDCDFLRKMAGNKIGHYPDSFVWSGLRSFSLI